MGTRSRRVVLFALATTFAIVVAGALTLWLTLWSSRTGLAQWIGQQFAAVANHYLVPQLSFADLQYQYPRTIILTDIRLRTDDPAGVGGKADILLARHLTVELAEIPRRGKVLHIRRLVLDHPELRLSSPSPKGSGLVGFTHLLKQKQHPSATQPEDRTPLSDIFEIRHIQISDGMILYDPRQPGEAPMYLDQINTQFQVEPAGAGSADTGWYRMNMRLERAPVFTCDAKGKLNLDTAALDFSALHLAMVVGRAQDHYLPPALQKLLQEHEVSGKLDLDGRGVLPLENWRGADLALSVMVTHAHFASGSHRWPIQAMSFGWSMSLGRAKLDPFTATVFGGEVQAAGLLRLVNPMDASVTARFSHIRLEQTLREGAEDSSSYSGDLSGEVSWQGPLDAISSQSHGGGNVSVVNGRLVHFPVVGEILAALRGAMKLVGVGSGRPHDTADAVFTFEGDHLDFSKIDLGTDWAQLRGAGDAYFNKRLDLHVNAGPVEKAESLLGGIGEMLGKVTDQFADYQVKGTTDAPQVGVKIIPAIHLPG